MLDQLANPPEGFKDVVRAHFYLKRDFLLEEYEKMAQKFKSANIKKQLLEVKEAFRKLEPPGALKSWLNSKQDESSSQNSKMSQESKMADLSDLSDLSDD